MLGCNPSGWVGDGICDDLTNTMQCNYDGGDCCLDPVNTQYCSECQCLDGVGSTVDPTRTEPTTTGTMSPSGIMKNTMKKQQKKIINFFC